MVFKFVLVAAFVAFANAAVLHHDYAYGSPIHAAVHPVFAKSYVDAEYNAHPQYSYSYGVHDAHTGDSKSQVEYRNGDVVKGQYSLVESDGTKRTVDYAADDVNGFNAVVSKTPVAHHVAHHVAAPVAYSAPAVSHVAYSAAPAVHTGHVSSYAVPHHANYYGDYSTYASPYVGYNSGLGYTSGHHYAQAIPYAGYSNVHQGYASPVVQYHY